MEQTIVPNSNTDEMFIYDSDLKQNDAILYTYGGFAMQRLVSYTYIMDK